MASLPKPQPASRFTSRDVSISIRKPTRNPLHLWHLLSFDAPTVAALWTYSVASANHLHLPWTSIAAMATAVWLLYAGDRLLDSRLLITRPDARDGIEARHRFHHRHRHSFRLGIAAASLLLAVLIRLLPAEAIHLYLVEGGFLAGYFLLIHATPSNFRLLKECAVGLFFAAAVFIPTVSRAPALRLPLAAPALLFAALCTLNCLYIYIWEHPAHTPATTHPITRLALRHLHTLTPVLLLTALVIACTSRSTIPMAIALAATALIALHSFRRRLTPTTLRAAADLALLTPILFLSFR